MNDLHALLAAKPELPARVRRIISTLWDEVRDIEPRVESIDQVLLPAGKDRGNFWAS